MAGARCAGPPGGIEEMSKSVLGARGVAVVFGAVVAMLAPAAAQAGVCLVDQDGDGLCDLWETTCLVSAGQRTSLIAVDSDGDLIRDDVEVGASGVPEDFVAPDTDGNGFIDG